MLYCLTCLSSPGEVVALTEVVAPSCCQRSRGGSISSISCPPHVLTTDVLRAPGQNTTLLRLFSSSGFSSVKIHHSEVGLEFPCLPIIVSNVSVFI